MSKEPSKPFVLRKGNPLNVLTIGVDPGWGNDRSVYTIIATPTKLRRFFRKIKLDWSHWEYKIIEQGYSDERTQESE